MFKKLDILKKYFILQNDTLFLTVIRTAL